jgi:hypothetical protein
MYGNARDTSWRLIRNEQKKQILRVIRGMPRRGVLLAKDETELLLFPPLRSTWSLRGQPAQVLLSGLECMPRGFRGYESSYRPSRVSRPYPSTRAGFSGIFGAGALALPRLACRDSVGSGPQSYGRTFTAVRCTVWAAVAMVAQTLPRTQPKMLSSTSPILYGAARRSDRPKPQSRGATPHNNVLNLKPHGIAMGTRQGCRQHQQYAGIDEPVDRFINYLSALSNREALGKAGMFSETFWLNLKVSKNF